jgi:hypothetical protein
MATTRHAFGIGVVLAISAASSPAADRPAFSAESSVFGQYVNRGVLASRGPVLQNSASVLWRGAHFNAFTNLELDSADGRRGRFSEINFDAGYERSLEREKVRLSAGAIHNMFPNTPFAASNEVYAGIALAVPLNPAVKAYYIVDGIRGMYVTFDVSHSFAMPSPRPGVSWSVELAAGTAWGSAGYGLGNFEIREHGLVDLRPGLALPANLGKRWRVVPRLSYAALAREKLRHCGIAAPHGFVPGLTVGYTF